MNPHPPGREDGCDQVAHLRPAIPPSTAGLLPPIDPSEGSLAVGHHTHHCMSGINQKRSSCEHIDRLTIGILPDEVLLEIFGFYVCEVDHEVEWETLVHVCRRWRCVVFGSPHRLGLRLICTEGTPARKVLDIWPASLPIVIRVSRLDTTMEDDLIAAFEQTNRICEIHVDVVSADGLEILAELTQNQLPSLTNLEIILVGYEALVLPESFLGGSASSLESLYLKSTACPSPKLLLTATNLNRLLLEDIPFLGYIPPETMIECLSWMVKLEELGIRFSSSRHPGRPRQASRPLPPHIILPVLTTLAFKGVHEYLYRIFAHINAPLLDSVKIEFFDFSAVFEISQIAPFVGRTGTFEDFKHAHMPIQRGILHISLSLQAGATADRALLMSVKCSPSVWRLQSLTHSYGPRRPPLTNFQPMESFWPHGGTRMSDSQWLQLLRFFPALETICISRDLTLYLAPALDGLSGEQVTEILPALQYLFIDGLVPPMDESIGKFVAARQLSGHPIVVQCWPGENIVQHMRREADD